MKNTDGNNHSELLDLQITALNQIHDAGYEKVEVFHGSQPSWFGERIAHVLSELNLEAYSVHLPKTLAEMEFSLFNNLCQHLFAFVTDVGVEVLVVHPPDVNVYNPTMWQDRLEGLLNYADDSSCTISLETIPNTGNRVVENLYRYGNRHISVTVDIEHMHVMNLNMHYMIEHFGQKIVNIHVRDSDGRLRREDGSRNFLSLGQGHVDFMDIINTLRKSGYAKALTVELGPTNYEREIHVAREFMIECLTSTGT